jgi:hypothetical protein
MYMDAKSGDAVRVSWRDSKSLSGWVPRTYHKFMPGTIESIGYVVKSDEEGLTLATSFSKDETLCYDPFTIPQGAIEACEILEGIEIAG